MPCNPVNLHEKHDHVNIKIQVLSYVVFEMLVLFYVGFEFRLEIYRLAIYRHAIYMLAIYKLEICRPERYGLQNTGSKDTGFCYTGPGLDCNILEKW